MRLFLVLLLLAVLFAAAGCATVARRAAEPTGILFGSIAAAGQTLPYAVYVPRDYDRERAWPLVLFLHGKGESGDDGLKQVIQGLGSAIQWAAPRWPAIVLFPQKPRQDAEWEQYEPAVMALVARARERWSVDPRRIVLTGLSQGGHGTWVLGARYPELWAALVPVCGYAGARFGAPALPAAFGGTAAQLAPALARLPIWAFHGEDDDVVPAGETRELAAAIQAAGGSPRTTFFPGVGHGAWDPAYRDAALATWVLSQRRGAGTR